MNFSWTTILIYILIPIEAVLIFYAYKGIRCQKSMSEQKEVLDELEERFSHRTMELQKAMNELERLNSIDPLTKISNRKSFMVLLKNEITRYGRHKRPFTLLIVDMDNFKKVNDEYGHSKGDEVIKRIAKVVAGCARNTDYVGRIGGQEFGILLPETNSDGAAIFAKRLRLDISNTIFYEDKTEIAFSVNASVGGCVVDGIVEPNLEKIYANADEAVFKSKKFGRNQSTIDVYVEKISVQEEPLLSDKVNR